jgi:hypothetical protein
MERIWKEMVIASFKVLSQHLHEQMRKTTKILVRVAISRPRFEPRTSQI